MIALEPTALMEGNDIGLLAVTNGPWVSMSVEEPFNAPSFHAQWCGFLLKSTYPDTAL